MEISQKQQEQIYQIIRESGQWGKELAQSQFEVSEKGKNDYVTSIDQALDRRLNQAFSQLFPQDGIITEENPISLQAFQHNFSRLWCIDPLDGTQDFIQGDLHYALMVGLLEKETPLAGWVYAPSFDQMYYGGPNWGLFYTQGNGRPEPLKINPPPPLDSHPFQLILGDKDQKNFGSVIRQVIPDVQFYSLGSFGLKVLEIIQGRAGLYLYLNGRVKIWDTVGPLALAKTAGLICCDLQGNPLQWNAEVMELHTLTHKQSVVIGWPEYIDSFREKLYQAISPCLPIAQNA